VTVLGYPDYSRAAAVQPNGMITLPLLQEVSVASLTVAEIKTKLTSLLARDYLQRPQVEVKVKEYQSQFVTVYGEVNNPGRKPLRGQTTLWDVLVEANSFTPRASGEVVITRTEGTFADGQNTARVQFGKGAPTLKDVLTASISLRDGDIITASPAYHVQVDGEVMKPGRYTLEPDQTVSDIVSLAGGLTKYGKTSVKVRRLEADGKVRMIEVNLKDVRNGKKPDLPLKAGDIVMVGKKLF